MQMSSLSYERRKAVLSAWKKEKEYVSKGAGTRDWSQKEQKELLAKGSVHGYEGHHMKSVDGHNSRAGDPNNIQFLTRKEHFDAHNKNFRNNTNGYYDPKTKTMHDFGRNKPSLEPHSLSNPLSERQRKIAMNPEIQKKKTEMQNKAKNYERRTVNKKSNKTKTTGKAPVKTDSKTLTRQRTSPDTGKKAATSTKSKTLSGQRSIGSSGSKSRTSSGKTQGVKRG